jgi:hypothetical protein
MVFFKRNQYAFFFFQLSASFGKQQKKYNLDQTERHKNRDVFVTPV